MRKATKTIISFAVVLIAGLNFIVPAFAQDPFTNIAIGGISGLSGAGLFSSMAGMSGVNINWNSNTSDPLDAMYNVLNPDHVYFSGEKHEANPTEYPEDVYDYITVDIGDWLDAQSEFIVKFIQENNVTDSSSGVIVDNYSYNGVEMFINYFGALYSKNFSIQTLSNVVGTVQTFTFPDGYYVTTVNRVDSDGYIRFTKELYIHGDLIETASVGLPAERNPVCVNYRTGSQGGSVSVSLDYTRNGALEPGETIGISKPIPNSNATKGNNILWTSGTVNQNVFNGWEAAKVKIPHNLNVLPVNWDIPDFVDAINELWENNQQGQIVIEDTDQPVPPPPVPTTPLGEMPFDDWVDLWGQGIYQQLENQSDTLDLIGSNGIDAIEELESIDTNTEDLVETAESIDTNIGIGNGILGGIRSLAQSAVNYLEAIAEHVGELVEEIVEGTETLIAGILNQIPQAFGVIFGPIKQASSIWHYVVEWITSIGAPFQFIWSMASGTSYYVILPVYASLAAAVVLAFFKRFGR